MGTNAHPEQSSFVDVTCKLPEPHHILIDGLEAVADAIPRVSASTLGREERLSMAAWLLKDLDEHGFVLVADPRKGTCS